MCIYVEWRTQQLYSEKFRDRSKMVACASPEPRLRSKLGNSMTRLLGESATGRHRDGDPQITECLASPLTG
jgi:hypothetical protein